MQEIVIIVKGRPVSINSSSRSKTRWRDTVVAAAKKVCTTPLDGMNLIMTIRFFHKIFPDFDTQNISKPICDALQGIAYYDDNQLKDCNAGRRDISSPIYLKDASPELASAIMDGEDFAYIKIKKADTGVDEI